MTDINIWKDKDLSPVWILSDAEWECVHNLVQNDADAARAFAPWKEAALTALNSFPQPPNHLAYEGRIGDDPARLDTTKRLADMEKLRALLYAWKVTGEIRFAKKTRDFTLAWAQTLAPSGNPINENKIDAVFTAALSLHAGFSTPEWAIIASWLKKIGDLHLSLPRAENWEAKRLKILTLVGLAIQEDTFLEAAMSGLKKFIATDLRADGTSADLESRDAMSYHVSGLLPLLEILVALRGFETNLGDLYRWQAPNGASLLRSVEFIEPYARGEAIYAQWANSKVKLDHQRFASGDEYYRPGRAWDPKTSLKLWQFVALLDPNKRELVELLAEGQTLWPDVLSAAIAGKTRLCAES